MNPDTPGAKESNSTSSIRTGMEGRVERAVPREWTIAVYDPRLPEVFSTPAMIGMMEVAAAQAVQPALAPGTITVGTRIEVDHLKAVGTGAHVVATARLSTLDGRFLVFEVEAKSGGHVIGRGRVFRTVVEINRFSANVATRKGR